MPDYNSYVKNSNNTSAPIKQAYQQPKDRLTSQYRLFPPDYFSHCEMAIYFGDTFIDEITGLQFAMQEQVLPLYGYSDYRFREFAHGNRIVTGSFSINFKESAYIYAIMRRLKMNPAGAGVDSAEGEGLANQKTWTMKDVEDMYQEWMLKEIERVDQNKALDPALKSKMVANSYDTFETIADYYERALWGSKDGNYTPFGKSDLNMNFASLKDNIGLLKERRTAPFFDQPFTITISYGNNAAAFAARANGTYQDIYGNSYAPKSVLLPIEETVKTIVGVHLFGVSQQQDMSGNPIQETYQFMAQDLDNFDDLISITPAT